MALGRDGGSVLTGRGEQGDAGAGGVRRAPAVKAIRDGGGGLLIADVDAADVTAAALEAARENACASLDPVQVESLRAFAKTV